jgi:hypothetical protein
MFSLQQNWRIRKNRFCLEARGVGGKPEEVRGKGRDTNMYTYMNK